MVHFVLVYIHVILKRGTLAESIYSENDIEERHRHRYEFNNEFREQIEENGMVFSVQAQMDDL